MRNYYTPDVLAGLVRDRLVDMAITGMKAAVSVAKDPWHVIEILTASPRGLRLVVHWAGEEALGEVPEEPLETQRVEVILGYALGLKASADAALVESTDDRPSLLKLVSDVKVQMLGMVFAEEDASEGLFRYRGAEPVETPEGIPLAAYKLKFELDTSTPEIPEEIPEEE